MKKYRSRLKYILMKNRYEIMLPPFKLDYDNWSEKTAQEYLQWFKEKTPERARYILRFAGICDKIDESQPISPVVLKAVWKWFLNEVCRFEKVPRAELKKQRELYGYLGESFITKERFDVFSELVITDIAMLVSEIYTGNHPSIYWACDCKPKSYAFVNQPALKGFTDTRFEKPFSIAFVPVNMVHVQALKAKHNRETEDDLFYLYSQWESFVHDRKY